MICEMTRRAPPLSLSRDLINKTSPFCFTFIRYRRSCERNLFAAVGRHSLRRDGIMNIAYRPNGSVSLSSFSAFALRLYIFFRARRAEFIIARSSKTTPSPLVFFIFFPLSFFTRRDVYRQRVPQAVVNIDALNLIA